jgi:hypothetical protein
MLTVFGYFLFSFSALLALHITIAAADELAAQLSEGTMPIVQTSTTSTLRTPSGVPAQPVIVERSRQLFVEFPDGRTVKCHNFATAKAVIRHG